MANERIKKFIAMLMIGDGVATLVQPERHALLWKLGPTAYPEAMEAFTRRPWLTRLLDTAEAGLGLRWASRQRPQ